MYEGNYQHFSIGYSCQNFFINKQNRFPPLYLMTRNVVKALVSYSCIPKSALSLINLSDFNGLGQTSSLGIKQHYEMQPLNLTCSNL